MVLELEQEVLRKGKPNKLGFGSYKADNTELIRPYQQEASSPIGRGYPISVVSGAPTVYDPRAGIKEDPVVVLLKKILGMKTVIEKATDAGFMSTVSVAYQLSVRNKFMLAVIMGLVEVVVVMLWLVMHRLIMGR